MFLGLNIIVSIFINFTRKRWLVVSLVVLGLFSYRVFSTNSNLKAQTCPASVTIDEYRCNPTPLSGTTCGDPFRVSTGSTYSCGWNSGSNTCLTVSGVCSSNDSCVYSADQCRCTTSPVDCNNPGGGGDPGPNPNAGNPRGSFGPSSCTSSFGWACDSYNSYRSTVTVDFFRDAPPSSGGTYIGSAQANLPREQAVADYCGGIATQGFEFECVAPNGLASSD